MDLDNPENNAEQICSRTNDCIEYVRHGTKSSNALPQIKLAVCFFCVGIATTFSQWKD